MSERRCPVHGEPLVQDTIHGVTVDRCAHGVWLDRSELFQITEAERREAGAWDRILAHVRAYFKPFVPRREDERGEGAHVRGLRCPVGGEPMTVDSYHDVWIDRCAHGVWLDAGELELILQRLRSDPSFMDGAYLRLSEMEL